jgi:tetratricopeptide (TPR) repeat protein
MIRLAAGVLVASLLVAGLSRALAPVPVPAPEPSTSGALLESSVAGDDAPSPGRRDLERIRADVAFWSARATARPTDFVSLAEWASSESELARATGDVAAWTRAEAAAADALTVNPEHRPALAVRGAALLALHRFADARGLARSILEQRPRDPAALAILGDASFDLGAYDDAGRAYTELDALGRSAASAVRLGRLAWLDGRVADALVLADAAVTLAESEGAAGERLAWYRLARFELLAATGDAAGAEAAARVALEADPASASARVALARLEAAAGRFDAAIALLDEAVAAVPRPDALALRSTVLALRDEPGDARRAAADALTIRAIADLASNDGVFDRTYALYLADHGLEPGRAVAIAAAELESRSDVDGHDALAWALFAAGRYGEADEAMRAALAQGTRQPRLLYHAGMIAAAVGDADRARTLLTDSIALDAAFDPLQLRRARAALEALP